MSDQGSTTKKVLDALQQAFLVGIVAFLLGGVTFVIAGKHDRGFALIFVAVIFMALLLLLRLYRSRYRL